MELLNDMFINPLRVMKNFLLGRGFLTLAVLAASAVGGITPALVVGIGGALFSGFMRLGNQGLYEEQMLDLYRDDIAEHLGKDPKELTRADLKQAARSNEIIDQALARQRHKNWITFGTAALAGLSTAALVAAGLPGALGGFFLDTIGEGTLGSVLKYASTGFVSTLSSLVLHDGLQLLIGHKTGVSKAAAHDRILDLERSVARGMVVSKEQVYGVLVAGNSELQQNIAREFGKPYERMGKAEQGTVLETIGVSDTMHLLARHVTNGEVKPGKLAYMIADASIAQRQERREQTFAPARSHVQKLGLSPHESLGHVARLEQQRQLTPEQALS